MPRRAQTQDDCEDNQLCFIFGQHKAEDIQRLFVFSAYAFLLQVVLWKPESFLVTVQPVPSTKRNLARLPRDEIVFTL
jgi:hypothetical protein